MDGRERKRVPWRGAHRERGESRQTSWTGSADDAVRSGGRTTRLMSLDCIFLCAGVAPVAVS